MTALFRSLRFTALRKIYSSLGLYHQVILTYLSFPFSFFVPVVGFAFATIVLGLSANFAAKFLPAHRKFINDSLQHALY